MQNLTPTLSNHEPSERTWSHPSKGDTLPAQEKLHPYHPHTHDNPQEPTLRTPFEGEKLLTVFVDGLPAIPGAPITVTAGKPVKVQCRFTKTLKSELARNTSMLVDKRYKRKAFLVAFDSELLRRQGAKTGLSCERKGISPVQAAKLKSLGRPCQCAKKVLIPMREDLKPLDRPDSCEVEVCLFPQYFPEGSAQVFLQVVLEASIDKTYWTIFGNMEPIKVLPGQNGDIARCPECHNTGIDANGNDCGCGSNFDHHGDRGSDVEG